MCHLPTEEETETNMEEPLSPRGSTWCNNEDSPLCLTRDHCGVVNNSIPFPSLGYRTKGRLWSPRPFPSPHGEVNPNNYHPLPTSQRGVTVFGLLPPLSQWTGRNVVEKGGTITIHVHHRVEG